LSDDSLLGRTLGILIGYKAAPAGIQIAFYLVTAALLAAGLRWQQRRMSALSPSVSPVPRDGSHEAML
jgi:high-affinity iron transporter